MLSINTNLSSLIAQQSMTSATNKLNQAIERMTTGYKINGAKDNAANYSISTNMTTKINSYMVAEDNVAMGLDMLSTANGSLDQISDKLTRLRALATQASNGTYGAQSLTAINSEANALVDEINRIYSTAEYNGRKLFTGAETNAEPAAAAYGARATSTNTTYTDEEVAAMTSISDVSSFTSGECYSISTAEELARLAELANSGVGTTGATFVLANDIDLKEWCEAHAADGGWTPIGIFTGSFDGNGHVISNLTINRPTEDYQGLFGCVSTDQIAYFADLAEIKNVGLEGVNITGRNYVGGLVGYASGNDSTVITIFNNYVTGEVTSSSGNSVGGLVGHAVSCYGANVSITNNYATCNVTGGNSVGGLVGHVECDFGYGQNVFLTDNYATGTVTGTDDYVGGLAGYIYNVDITKSYTTGCVTSMGNYVGGLGGYFFGADIINSYATGNVTGESYVGGLAGYINTSYYNSISITNSYATGNVNSTGQYVGGLVGEMYFDYGSCNFTNNYTTGTVTGSSDIGGFVGHIVELSDSLDPTNPTGPAYTNCASVQTDAEVIQLTEEEILTTYTLDIMGYTEDNGWTIVNGQPLLSWQKEAKPVPAGSSNYVTLQVGINADSYSQIGLEFGFALDGIEGLRQIGLDTSTDYLSTLDNMLDVVSAKATEYGAAQNRLESALDEIAIQYDNLVSSRSTLRDADIAEVSSQYIQQQILQQASATLLATANQSPSIALQLI